MKTHSWRALVLLAIVVCGCSSDSNGDDPGATTPMPPTLPGVYTGTFPCSNCAAIIATLWLRSDGRFVLRQAIGDDAPVYALGRWIWDEHDAQAVLRGAGPERYLTAIAADRLRLRAASPIEQVLSRDPTAPPFTDRVRLDGESSITDHGAVFAECLTGLPLVVATTGAYRELRRQHRLLNARGTVARTTIEGHLTTTTDGDNPTETLVVDRVVTLRPGKSC